jgi:hypothetical protein
MTLLKWFIAILVLGQVCWWILRYLQSDLAGKT